MSTLIVPGIVAGEYPGRFLHEVLEAPPPARLVPVRPAQLTGLTETSEVGLDTGTGSYNVIGRTSTI